MIVRIERRVGIAGSDVERVVSVEIPADADEFLVSIAVQKVEDISEKVARLGRCCYVPTGAVHRSSCIYARDRLDWFSGLREVALREGMEP